MTLAGAVWALILLPKSLGAPDGFLPTRQYIVDGRELVAALHRRAVIVSTWRNACLCLVAMANEDRGRRRDYRAPGDPYDFLLLCDPMRGDIVNRATERRARLAMISQEAKCPRLRPHR